jgi:hypothetical protein
VSANPPGGVQLPGAGTRVHGDGLADDEAILDELADGLAGVGVGNLADLVRVEPDLALAAADNGCREALLGAKVDPIEQELSASCPCEWLQRRGEASCEEGLATPRVAGHATSASCRLLCRRGNVCGCGTIDGGGGILTFSMKLSAVVVVDVGDVGGSKSV